LAELPPAPEAGFLICDKPAGSTSHQMVAAARREHGMRAGHAGTLDPFATGVLVILLGRATRLQRYVLGRAKTYEATARLGWRSSTGDRDGELTETGEVPTRLELPTGRIRQRVPMTSAVHVDGERLYKKAHRGEHEDERPVREVEVYRAELLDSDAERARFLIECSAGTYIRTLVEELGDAYCEELRRTAVGDLSIDDAGSEVLAPERLVAHLPERELTHEQALDVVHGIKLETSGEEGPGPLRLTAEGRLLAIARPQGKVLKTEVVLA
jgi:tRNA pseudouridine55 synthase